jgi:aminotransferase EvaB
MQEVPVVSLEAHTQRFRERLNSAFDRVLSSSNFILGDEVSQFESELASYQNTKSAVAVANGTEALQIAMQALGVRAGDAVVSVANAGGYSSVAANAIGAQVYYCDVSRDNLQISPESFSDLIASGLRAGIKFKAVVVTHLFGSMAPVGQIVNLANAHGIPVIEDCAQALGSSIGGQKAGTFGHVATFSFYPTKNLGGLGDAGAITTDSPEIAYKARKLRQYGWDSKYSIQIESGLNSRMDELQAAALRVKLPFIDLLNAERCAIHSQYENTQITRGRLVNKSGPSYNGHLAVLDTNGLIRDDVRELFKSLGIRTDIHYPIPDHKQRGFHVASELVSLAVTEQKAESILTIPLYPEMEPEYVHRVIQALGS